MVVHGVAPNETRHGRTTLYYRFVAGGRTAGMLQCNTAVYSDPWCEMPVMSTVT
jgi:hypothetical protein